jgi:hypothetical protein
MSVKITLDLEFALPYACGFIPVELGKANRTRCQLDLSNSFPLPPPRSAIATPQPSELSNT